MGKTALITGITGQDGSYLAELLLEKGYHVHGIVRRCSTFNTDRIDHVYQDPHEPDPHMFLHYGDLTDGQNITNLVLDVEPDEIYNLGAQSHVRVSFDSPAYTVQVTGMGALNVLEAARQLNKRKEVRIYQASSSEMYGDVCETPQNGNRRRSRPRARTPVPRFTRFTKRSITERPMTCLRPTEFCSTTNRHDGVRRL